MEFLITLVLHVCDKQSGACKDLREPYFGEARACAIAGMFIAAQWNADNQGWRVEHYECKVTRVTSQARAK